MKRFEEPTLEMIQIATEAIADITSGGTDGVGSQDLNLD